MQVKTENYNFDYCYNTDVLWSFCNNSYNINPSFKAAWGSMSISDFSIDFHSIGVVANFYQWNIEGAKGCFYEIYNDENLVKFDNGYYHDKNERNLAAMLNYFRKDLLSIKKNKIQFLEREILKLKEQIGKSCIDC